MFYTTFNNISVILRRRCRISCGGSTDLVNKEEKLLRIVPGGGEVPVCSVEKKTLEDVIGYKKNNFV
jgi:hypothetical protein